jgi:membrane protease YdiL (CAAX protease family)
MIKNKTSTRNLLPTLGQILLILLGIQLARAAIYAALGMIGTHTGWYEPLDPIPNGITFVLLGVILFLVFRPPLADLGLASATHTKTTRWMVRIWAALLAAMLIWSFSFAPDQIITNLVGCVVFPLFEEPLFRGWIWNRLQSVLLEKWAGALCTILTTLLFSIWHLGYWEVVAQHSGNALFSAQILHIMLMKMVIAAVIGLAAGLLRWRTGSIHASILLHATWNLFGH